MRILVAGVLAMVLAACSPLSARAPVKGFGTLVITQFPVQKELGRYSLGADRTFTLSFIHSVSKTRVLDIYEIQGNQIVQTEELFKAHGAGLPSSPDEPDGILWEKTKDQFILHMKRAIPKLVVRTDRNYHNRLILDSGTIDLNQWDDQPLLLFFEP